ncbi:adenosylmethionine decarboxylase [Diaphorobacter sp. HDW4A]|uniref:adenosylmethionine decarboxylase n=1 Tax=Diaphorobacter sp. HDW4A TaxID=2714924 RepID=UPI00140E0258|nr:adenosylmethionine decarboxylase [Diaphorobacter sp. HDW4A]QIL81503.1 adenosylmethionine decarboxylase [Diaphorobacter sp. HDW4A]
MTTQPQNARAAAREASGLHLIGDLHGCEAGAQMMLDAAFLEAFCLARVTDAGLTTVGSLFHSFGAGGGVTGVVVLAESHLSVHTWPESDYVTLDVFVCNYSGDNRPRAQQLFDALRGAFKPASTHQQRIERA